MLVKAFAIAMLLALVLVPGFAPSAQAQMATPGTVPHVIPFITVIKVGSGGINPGSRACGEAIVASLRAHSAANAPDATCAEKIQDALKLQREAPHIPTPPAHPLMTPAPPPR